jgi:EpsI family protein
MKAGNFILRWSAVVVLLAATAGFMHIRRHAEVVPQADSLDTFPMQLAEWQGREVVIESETREVLGPAELLSRVYARSQAEPYIDFFIAYFPSQRTGDTIHSPKNCLPGSGWTPMESTEVVLPAPGMRPVHANRYIIAKGAERQLVLYWYQAHGRAVASEYWAKFYLVADAMRTNRTDGALVRIVTPLVAGEPLESAEARAVQFAQQILPSLNRYIPD